MLSNNIGKVSKGIVTVTVRGKKIVVIWTLYYLEDGWHIFIKYEHPKTKKNIRTELPFGGPLSPTRINSEIRKYIHKHV